MTATKTQSAGSGEQLGLEAGVKTGVPAVRGEKAPDAVQVSSAAGGVASIQDLMHYALERGADVGALEKLVDLHERVTKREAALEFARAMAAFQAACPPIKKDSTAKIATRGGGSYSYTYAELDSIAGTVNPILRDNGLSYTWNSSVDEKGLMLTCDCIVRHINGHSETSRFTLPIANDSAMSAQQKVAAALTFAKRQSLTAALGLVTTDEDTDAVTREVDTTPITDEQLTTLEELIDDAEIDGPRFLKFLGVTKLAELPRARFVEAKNAIAEKKRRKEGK